MRVSSGPLAARENLTKQYYCVDLLKFICSLLVVAIHVPPLSSYNSLLDYGLCNYIARLAVPFYFVCSGFFLFRKTSRENFDKSIPLRYAARIFRLYVIWTIIYFPLVAYADIIRDEKGMIHGILAWIQRCIFTGSYSYLWYLNATVVATLILTFLLCRKIKLSTIMVLTGTLFLIGSLGRVHLELLEPLRQLPFVWSALKMTERVILTTQNGLFFGALFMGIGMMFAYRPVNMPLKKAAIGFGVSMALLLFEAAAVHCIGRAKGYGMYLCLVPAVYFLFYLATHIELKPNKVYKYLRTMGILIYCLHYLVHPFVFKGYTLLGRLLPVDASNSLLIYFSVVLITFVISHIIIKLSSTKQFAWLKMLYS